MLVIVLLPCWVARRRLTVVFLFERVQFLAENVQSVFADSSSVPSTDAFANWIGFCLGSLDIKAAELQQREHKRVLAVTLIGDAIIPENEIEA
jgi:hypothetical protein